MTAMPRTFASRWLLVAAGLVLSSAAAFAQTVSFTARRDFAIGSSEPQSVAVGDFNGDGVTDLAVAAGRGIVILLGNGDETFQPAVRYTSVNTTGPLVSVAVGDFNGYGVPDLATANYHDSVSVFLGNGDGTFQPDVTFAAGSRPTSATSWRARKPTCMSSTGTYPIAFHPVFDAVQLSKLSLLGAAELNRLVAEADVDNTIYGPQLFWPVTPFDILFDAVRSIDGNQQWQEGRRRAGRTNDFTNHCYRTLTDTENTHPHSSRS
jgi:hypothetical protein